MKEEYNVLKFSSNNILFDIKILTIRKVKEIIILIRKKLRFYNYHIINLIIVKI